MVTAVDNTTLFRALIKIFEKSEQKEEKSEEEQIIISSTILLSSRPAAYSKLQSCPSGFVRQTQSKSKQCRVYSSQARQILSDITELRDLVLDKRKEYILCSNAFSIYATHRFMSEEDRKKFDRETDLAIKQCTKLMKDLEIRIGADSTLRSSDETRHLMTIVNLLSVYLKEVLAIIAQLRQIHIQKTRQIRKICHLANLVDTYGARLDKVEKEERLREEKLRLLEIGNNTKVPSVHEPFGLREIDSHTHLLYDPLGLPEIDNHTDILGIYEPSNKVEQTQLLTENRRLLDRFTTTDSELQRLESHVAEIQKLQNIFAEKISEQEQNIDIIHSRTVYILDNLEQANDFIREAIKNQANRRVIMIFCLLVLTFTLLFLDWYNP